MGSLQLAGLVLGNTWQERIIPGIQVTVIGMTVVFAVLILLYGILILVGKFGGSEQPAKPEDRECQAPPAGQDALTVEVEQAEAVAACADVATVIAAPASEGQLVAVIAAALAAVETVARPAASTMRHAPAVQAKPSWVLAGRMELLTVRERLPRG